MPLPQYLHCDQPLHVTFLREAYVLPEELTSETEEEPRGSDSQLKGSLSVSFIDDWLSVMVVGIQNTVIYKASILAERREQSCLKSFSDKCCDGKHPTRKCKPKTVKEVLGMGAAPFLFVILKTEPSGWKKESQACLQEGNLGKEHIQYKAPREKKNASVVGRKTSRNTRRKGVQDS